MGNLCSSGAERSEKKDDNQLPDKPRDGEDEALLPKGEAAVELSAEGIHVTSSAGNGGGICAELGDAIQGKTALADAERFVEVETQQIAAQSQSAFTQVAQSGKDSVDAGVHETTSTAAKVTDDAVNYGQSVTDDVNVVVEKTVASAVASTQDVAAKVQETAKETAEETVKQINQEVTSANVSLTASISQVQEAAASGVEETKLQVESVSEKAIHSLESVLTEKTSDALSALDSKVDALNAESKALSEVENVQTEASDTLREAVEGVESAEEQLESLQSETEKSLQEQILDKFEELKSSTLNSASNLQDVNEVKINKEKQSLAEKAEEIVEDASSQLNNSTEAVKEGIADVKQELTESSQSVVEASIKVSENIEADLKETDAVTETAAEKLSAETENVTSIVTEEVQEVTQADVSAQLSSDVIPEIQQQLIDEASQAVTNVVDATVSTVDDAQKNIADDSAEILKEESNIEPTLFTSEIKDYVESSDNVDLSSTGIIDNIKSAAQELQQDDLKTVSEQTVEELLKAVDDKVSEVKEVSESTSVEPSFLEKAQSLLDAHRNSLDGSKTVAIEYVKETLVESQQSEETVNVSEESPVVENIPVSLNGDSSEIHDDAEDVNAAQEATARDFVESIIEKATSLVAESMNTTEEGDAQEEVSSPSEVSVERGEETMEPKKRGVMFVSPQRSEQSSSDLSSPPDLSPPAALDDLSPPTDESTSSSLSQTDETKEVLSSPLDAPTVVFEGNENNNNVLNNNTNVGDDDTFQRVAMEVTTKAVQDAIKIVTENGTGSYLHNPAFSNDLGVSDPSSPDNDEEDMTTTDSSQVERGSPVSDLTDTSAQGSVSESLSSYDPGAVFRQDVANLADVITSPGDAISPAEDTCQTSYPLSNPTDLINFEDSSSSQANTPTNIASNFDDYPPPPPTSTEDEEEPVPPPTCEVPSSLSFDDNHDHTLPGKPTIIINSPDSAHHTNGSTEDLATSQSEALI